MLTLAFSRLPEGGEHPSDSRPDAEASGNRARTRRPGNLLFVDPDAFLLDMIESGLSLSRPEWSVVSTHRPSEALEVLGIYDKFDAIVTEVSFDGSTVTGEAFISEIGHRYPEVPVFVMTARALEEIRGLDAAEYIVKPPDIDFLVSRVDRAIRRQRESMVRGISLQTFLQIVQLERKSCTVVVSHRGRVGEIFFSEGNLVQARIESIEGEMALFAILSMPEQSFRVVDRCDEGRAITTSLTALLMRWSVREDHHRRDGSASHGENEE